VAGVYGLSSHRPDVEWGFDLALIGLILIGIAALQSIGAIDGGMWADSDQRLQVLLAAADRLMPR
jgi:hypothetical protein